MLGEREPYFPMTWHFCVLSIMAFVLYVMWPIYLIRHLARNVSLSLLGLD